MLSRVLHDWSDADCISTLQRCAAAMTQPGARLVTVERTLDNRPERSSRGIAIELSDLNMQVMLGGRERTLPQFDALLSSASLRRIADDPLIDGFRAIRVARA